MAEIKLKPCPFCGGDAHIKQKSWDIFITGVCVECDICGAKTQWIDGPSVRELRVQAAKIWNLRVIKED